MMSYSLLLFAISPKSPAFRNCIAVLQTIYASAIILTPVIFIYVIYRLIQ